MRAVSVMICLSSTSLLGAVLTYTPGAGYKTAPLAVPVVGQTGFTLLPPEKTGVQFTNHLADRTVAFNRIYENGSGVAAGDVDGDGWCDLYFCRLEGPNVLYRNLGNWQFEEITGPAGVACPNQASTGAVFADVDADGGLDLLVNSIGGGTRLFMNQGSGRFQERVDTRLVQRFGSTSMALADVDGDGDLDLYVANYRTDTYQDRPPGLKVEAKMVAGKIVVTPPGRFIPIMPQDGGVQVIELGERDFLYINDGAGGFSPVSWTAGSFMDEDGRALPGAPMDWGLSVSLRDLDGDLAPDLYVCNDFFYSLDRVFLNVPARGFKAIARTALRNMSLSSMTIDVADINRDGHDDIFVADMLSRSHANRQRQRPNMMQGMVHLPVTDPEFRPEVPRNTLFLNRGDGTYAEIAQLSGLAATEWSWSAVFLDVDLDGFEDLLIATGNHHDVQDADVLQQIAIIRDAESPEERLRRFPPLKTENLLFRNRGDLTFEDKSAAWGFNLPVVSQAIASADLDNDGDLDVALNNLNDPASLYRNNSTAPRIAVRLKGSSKNLRGIGAKIKVFGGPAGLQSQEMICGGRYLSGDDTIRTFAAGSNGAPLRLEVLWRGGKRSVIEKVEPNSRAEIDEEGASAVPATPAKPAPQPWFEDASALLGHTHIDQPFDDFALQPLLTHKLSQLGPGAAWADLDGDGWEELVVGAGRGGRLAVFQNNRRGGFTKREHEIARQDQSGLVILPRTATNSMLILGSSSYEDGLRSHASVRQLDLPSGTLIETVRVLDVSAGPLASTDVDSDGDLDLFVGGRVAPGRYPEPVSSFLYRNTRGRFEPDPLNAGTFDRLGLISGAVFCDLDADADDELVLACEWGPILVFRNDQGKFQDATEAFGLAQYRGWWNGVCTGDFDGDGRLDLAASNWGRNSKYQSMLSQPLRLFYGTWEKQGPLSVLEAYFDEDSRKVVPWRNFEAVSKAVPFIKEHISTFRGYGNSSVQELLGDRWPAARELQATTLDSMVFLNKPAGFEAVPLPIEAQFAPSFGISAADFDGDGNDDLFLAHNFFGVEPETSRYDGGRGLLLAGNGRGSFSPVHSHTSGIEIYGEQRASAVADFDRDGRLDLVVTQNRGPTKLYRNAAAKPGLRLTLIGPPDNPRAIGASVRLCYIEDRGPVLEVHAGSGYWSQDGAAVLGARETPQAVWVRWPGGKETVHPLPAEAQKIQIEFKAE